MAELSEKKALAEKLRGLDPGAVRTFVGFDGFIDEVIHVVDTRYSEDSYDRLKNMADFGSKIVDSAGYSRNFEFVTVQRKAGGNGPNMAASLLSCGCELTYAGALGLPGTDPVFAQITENAKQVLSISNPGLTEAIEFYDGKLICSRLEPLNEVNAGNLDRLVGREKLAELFSECSLIGIENWTLVNHMTEVWEYLLDTVMPAVRGSGEKILFFDLCDPEKRSDEDLFTALKTVGRFTDYGRVVLGLNAKESYEIAAVLGMKQDGAEKAPLEETGKFIKQHMRLDTLVIHPTAGAYAFSEGNAEYADGPYCEKPKLTTGAGDNFNAGFALGLALGLSDRESLILGTANSGFYVRNCRSASFGELIDFITVWDDQELDREE